MPLIILFIFTLLLSAYPSISMAAVSGAANESGSFIKTFALGTVVGVIATLILMLFVSREHRAQYKKMVQKLKSVIEERKALLQSSHQLEQQQQDSQDMLEERVQERTLELNIALQELEQANQELEKKNTLDELTGLFNRRFYDQKIMAEYRRSKRNLTSLSLVIIDIDHFKNVNDSYGHLAGDQCLVWLGKQIKECLKRSTDMGFRYGGEEFCLILPDTDSEGAVRLAEILRTNIEKQPFRYQELLIPLTISSGISTYQQESDIQPEQLFMAADKALYQAKDNGRNQSQLHQFTQGQCATPVS